MLKEIRKKRTKFGALICVALDTPPAAPQNLASASAYTYIHRIGESQDAGAGLRLVGHRSPPRFKAVIGHYISQFQTDGTVAFVDPSVAFITGVGEAYDYADKLRLERAFGFWCGPADAPKIVVISQHLIEHLFHAIPDQMVAGPDCIKWIHGWMQKSIVGNRYFDANSIVGVAWPEAKPEKPVEPTPEPPPVEAPPVKRKRGRPSRKE